MKTPAPTPSEIFDRWLEQQPDSARVVLVFDSDRLLAESRALDPESVTDPQGRKWSLAVFRGDQVQFRRSFRAARSAGRAIIALLGPSQPDAVVDVSFIGDILSFQDGTPLDLSLAKYLGRFCPQISFPSRPLRRYRNALLAHKEELASAGKKITARWGKPDSWGQPQVAAMVLLAHAPSLSLEDVWPDADEPADYIAHGISLLLAQPDIAHLRSVTLDLLRGAALPVVADHRNWFEPDVEDVAAFLVLLAHAREARLQNPVTQLVGAGLLSSETDWESLAPLAPTVIEGLQHLRAWESVQAAADEFTTPKRVAKLLSLTHPGEHSAITYAKAFVASPVLPVRRAILGRVIGSLFTDSSDLESVSGVLLPEAKAHTDPKIGDGIAFVSSWNRISTTVAAGGPTVNNPAALLKLLTTSGPLNAETDLPAMHHAIRRFGDADLVEGADRLLYGEGGSDLRPAAGSLKDAVRSALHLWDQALAEMVRKSPTDFSKGGWCSVGYIRERLRSKVDSLSLGEGDGRAWILVFDGMRYDTWQIVVRPLLAEHFQIVEDKPLFTVPPSYTAVARTSLLAGQNYGEWRGFQGQQTSDEATLAAINLGLVAQEAKSKLRLVKEAETFKARTKVGATDKDARLVNVLIYGISDDCHDFHGDLAQFHQKIRTDMVGDPAHGVTGVLDDLLRRVGPDDEIVLVSDHGFTELLDTDGVDVPEATALNRKDAVHWRYTLDIPPAQAPESVEVHALDQKHFVAVGRKWFRRPGSTNRDRYSHGGISIAEMTVPAVAMRLATAKYARLAIEVSDDHIVMGEDALQTGEVSVVNRGTAECSYELQAVTNLNHRILSERDTLKPAESKTYSYEVLGKYAETIHREMDPSATLRAITFKLTQNAASSATVSREEKLTVTVEVTPKPTKLDTDALSGLDNI
jgi:hypothetical protein